MANDNTEPGRKRFFTGDKNRPTSEYSPAHNYQLQSKGVTLAALGVKHAVERIGDEIQITIHQGIATYRLTGQLAADLAEMGRDISTRYEALAEELDVEKGQF